MQVELQVVTTQGATDVIVLGQTQVTEEELALRHRQAVCLVEADSILPEQNSLEIAEILAALELYLEMEANFSTKKRSQEDGFLGKRGQSTRTNKKKRKLTSTQKKQKKADRIIDSYLSSGQCISEIAKEQRASHKHVKNLIRRYLLTDTPPQARDRYSIARQELTRQVRILVEDNDDPYSSCATIKRELETRGLRVSKPRISLILKKLGLHWLDAKAKARSNKHKDRLYDLEDLHATISILAEGVLDQNFVIVFVDEILFPLQQQAIKVWRKGLRFGCIKERECQGITLYCAASAVYDRFVTI
jgi:transposase